MRRTAPSTSAFKPFVIALFALLSGVPAQSGLLLAEHFDAKVPDNSPIEMVPGWHAYALRGGAVTDYSTEVINGLYPSLSHSASGAGTYGPGYLVMGASSVVSNAFIWMECPTNLDPRSITSISFYTRNDSDRAATRLVVRINDRWYATSQTFRDAGTNNTWMLNMFDFGTGPTLWRVLNTNTLALGSVLPHRLPQGSISAIGFFGLESGPSKIRIDELQVRSGSVMDAAYFVGNWIWADKVFDRQTCRFWKTIEIPGGVSVTRARLRLTADNSYRAFLDGMEFAKGSEWRRLTEYDLTLVLTPGTHVLGVEAFNEFGWAGLVAGVVVEMDNGRTLEIPSDSSWRVVPHGQKDWLTRKTPRDNWQHAQSIYRFREFPELPRNPVVLLPSALHPTVIKFWQRGWFQITLLSFCAVVAAICLRLLAKLTIQSQAQHVLQRERARIARDIHDELGAGLTHLVLMGETAQRDRATDKDSVAQFERVSESGRRLLRSIDEVVWMVNSQRDSVQDFETYVCRYAENFLRASTIKFRLNVDEEMPRATCDLATRRSLFLAVKESLNNIAKHSGATEVSLTINVVDKEVRVTIEDNGRGFEFSTRDMARNGLTNMANRMTELGGSCRVTSKPGSGCRIELGAPLKPHSQGFGRWWRRKRYATPTKNTLL